MGAIELHVPRYQPLGRVIIGAHGSGLSTCSTLRVNRFGLVWGTGGYDGVTWPMLQAKARLRLSSAAVRSPERFSTSTMANPSETMICNMLYAIARQPMDLHTPAYLLLLKHATVSYLNNWFALARASISDVSHLNVVVKPGTVLTVSVEGDKGHISAIHEKPSLSDIGLHDGHRGLHIPKQRS